MNLQLVLKEQWFNLTKSGIKTEDYREITPYWCNRLLLWKGESISFDEWRMLLITNGSLYPQLRIGKEVTFKSFQTNKMTLGYPKATDTERILKFKHLGIEIRTGNPEWGAKPNKLYFVIKHGIKTSH